MYIVQFKATISAGSVSVSDTVVFIDAVSGGDGGRQTFAREKEEICIREDECAAGTASQLCQPVAGEHSHSLLWMSLRRSFYT